MYILGVFCKPRKHSTYKSDLDLRYATDLKIKKKNKLFEKLKK